LPSPVVGAESLPAYLRRAIVDISTMLAEIRSLSIEGRLALVEAIWGSIAAESETLPVTGAQRQESERRLADYETNPDDVVSWDEVRDQALMRVRR
jgi:putative addiction module component (TIGR02574 family)